jgi:hypothetical protein
MAVRPVVFRCVIDQVNLNKTKRTLTREGRGETVAGIGRWQAQLAGLMLPRRSVGSTAQDRAERYLTALRRRSSTLRILFSIIVVFPTVVGGIYYGLIASKRYVSEAQYIVRGVSNHQSTGLTALLTTFGISRAADDTYAIQNFM